MSKGCPALIVPSMDCLSDAEKVLVSAINARRDECVKHIGKKVKIKGDLELLYVIDDVLFRDCGLPVFSLMLDKDCLGEFFAKRFDFFKLSFKSTVGILKFEGELEFI